MLFIDFLINELYKQGTRERECHHNPFATSRSQFRSTNKVENNEVNYPLQQILGIDIQYNQSNSKYINFEPFSIIR